MHRPRRRKKKVEGDAFEYPPKKRPVADDRFLLNFLQLHFLLTAMKSSQSPKPSRLMAAIGPILSAADLHLLHLFDDPPVDSCLSMR
jgi:hypothetical protein